MLIFVIFVTFSLAGTLLSAILGGAATSLPSPTLLRSEAPLHPATLLSHRRPCSDLVSLHCGNFSATPLLPRTVFDDFQSSFIHATRFYERTDFDEFQSPHIFCTHLDEFLPNYFHLLTLRTSPLVSWLGFSCKLTLFQIHLFSVYIFTQSFISDPLATCHSG